MWKHAASRAVEEQIISKATQLINKAKWGKVYYEQIIYDCTHLDNLSKNGVTR